MVGRCEVPGKAHIVLSTDKEDDANKAVTNLQRLQDIYNVELVPESGQSAYASISTSNGHVGIVGESYQVES